MKTLKIIIISIIILLFSVFLYFFISLSGTTWGGWVPDASIELNQKESKWVENIQKQYSCKIDYIGLDNNFAEDTVLYIHILFDDNSRLNDLLITKMEPLTDFLSQSFLKKSTNRKKLRRIKFIYVHKHNYNNDIVANNIPEERSCFFDIRANVVIPNEKYLIISKMGYFDYEERVQDLMFPHIGKHKHYYIDDWTNESIVSENYEKRSMVSFNGVSGCELYTAKKPIQIPIRDGRLESSHTYIFINNICISSSIVYKCYPNNNEFTYRTVFEKITQISPDRLKYSKKEKLNLADSLKTNPVAFEREIEGVLIRLKSDTTRIPWIITYETFQNRINYYSDVPMEEP